MLRGKAYRDVGLVGGETLVLVCPLVLDELGDLARHLALSWDDMPATARQHAHLTSPHLSNSLVNDDKGILKRFGELSTSLW